MVRLRKLALSSSATFLFAVFAFSSSATFLSATPQPQTFRQPLIFEPNRGQAPAAITWIARGPGYQLFFTPDGITIVTQDRAIGTSESNARSNASPKRVSSILRLKLAGGFPWNKMTGLEATGGVSNYLYTTNAKASVANIPHYTRLRVKRVYEGIDVVFYSVGGNLEYDFEVAEGADPRKIQLAFEGMQRMRVEDQTGDLVLTNSSGSEVRQLRPKLYQEIGKRRVDVVGGYKCLDQRRAAFTVADYDSRFPLVIDPAVAFINVFGGNGFDRAKAVAVDTDGNSYVTGSTSSTKNFPLIQAFDTTNDCDTHSFGGFCGPGATDGFVTKLSPSGAILFSTFFGGGDDDEGNGIAVDSSGVFVTGTWGIWSHDSASGSIVVFKFSFTGSPIYERFFGGSGRDRGNAIALDSHHNAWVTGSTLSADFPFKNAEFTSHTDSVGDGFVLEVSPDGNSLFSEPLGGSDIDDGNGIAVDSNDNAWITGSTCSRDFPGSTTWLQCSAYVVKFTGWHRTLTTIFPGSHPGLGDSGMAIAADRADRVYVAGYTNLPYFPTTPGAFQPSVDAASEQPFIARLNSLGQIENATYFGGNGKTSLYGIALDSNSAVYVSGSTDSTIFPGVPVLAPNPVSGFVSKLSPDLSALYYTVLTGNVARAVAISDAQPLLFKPPQIFVAGTANDPAKAFVDRLDEQPFVRFCNYWKPDQCINTESGIVGTSAIGPGWLSAQWQIEPLSPNGDPVGYTFWIQNRWHPDQYLNIESGQIQSSSISAGWLSARWTVEQLPGTHLYRIRNVWQPNSFLNIESGALQAAEIDRGWWSAMWTFERPY